VVSYAVTKEAYDKIFPLFIADWKKKTGQTITIKASYGGSGSQTRAVIDGLEADVVGLAMAADVNKIQSAGLIKPGWERELPNNSVATKSTIAFFLRPPHCQESCPLGLTRPPGGPTDDHATAL
jgi:sulfate transport system substrate-binding protein